MRQLVKDNVNTPVICMRGEAFSNKQRFFEWVEDTAVTEGQNVWHTSHTSHY